MKQILLIVFLAVFALAAGAPVAADQTVTFQWEDGNSPSPQGYRLYVREQGKSYDYATPMWQGAQKKYTATLPNGDYAAVVRAYSGANQSPNSNECVFSVSETPPALVIPQRPKQLIINFE